MQQRGCYATAGLLCNSGAVVQQRGCCATAGLLCNSGAVMQQQGCYATAGLFVQSVMFRGLVVDGWTYEWTTLEHNVSSGQSCLPKT